MNARLFAQKTPPMAIFRRTGLRSRAGECGAVAPELAAMGEFVLWALAGAFALGLWPGFTADGYMTLGVVLLLFRVIHLQKVQIAVLNRLAAAARTKGECRNS